MAEPESNAVADTARRFASSTGAAGGQAVAGAGQLPRSYFGAIIDGVAKYAVMSGDLTPEEAAARAAEAKREIEAEAPALFDSGAKVADVGRFITQAAREGYAIDPARDETLLAKIAQGAGTLPAAVASGPAAPLTVAAMMGEAGREDAAATLARRGITDPDQIRSAEDAAFMLNAPVGAASEALLGVPKMLASVRAMGGATTAAGRIGRQAALGAGREGAQEGIEQLATNVIAADAVGYDPERKRTEGVGEAVLLGSIIGAPTAAAFAGAQEIDARKQHADFAAKLDTAQNVPESTKTLLLQQDQLLRGLRPAQMFPEGSPELPLPDGLQRLKTPRGVFHYNPAQISEENLALLSSQGRENEVLGLGPVSKPEVMARAAATGEPVVSITERAPDGTEIKTAVGTAGTAPAQVAALEASKSPGSVVAVERPAQTITERLRAEQRAEEEKLAAAMRKETEERETRQRELMAKRLRFEETLAAADQLAADPQADFSKLKGALTSLEAAIDDNSLGLTLDQRQTALARVSAIRPRAEALRAEFEAAADARVAAAKAQAEADAAAAKAARRAEREALDAIEATGRDPREGNAIVDITKVPDAEFEALQNNLDAEGLDLPTWEKEMNRRIRAQESDDGPGVPRFTLLDLFTGANGAKDWASARLTLPTPDALRAAGDPLAGDMEAIRESLPWSYFRKDSKGDLDGLAARLRELGFREATTPAAALDLIRRAAGGEEIRPTASADYATGWDSLETSTEDTPRFLTETEVAEQFVALRSTLGPIARAFDIRAGIIADELEAEGYLDAARALRAGRLGEIKAATAPRLAERINGLRAQRRFVVIGTDAAKQGRAPGLLLHELAHPFFDDLPGETKRVLRLIHAEETAKRTGPLYRDGRLVTPLAVEAAQFPAARLAADPDLPVKEWFAERVRLLNEAWLAGRMPTGQTLIRRLWDQLLTRLRDLFAQVRGLRADADLFTDTFRAWIRTANQANVTRSAAAFAQKRAAQFATTQPTLDLGGIAVGLELPDTIRNLSPRWQDKTLRFESNLDKALYYAGGEGNTATRTAVIEHLTRETGLSSGQVATLARDLRRKLAPLARSVAAGGTLRVPPQMRPETRQLTGVDYATQAGDYADKNGTRPEKRPDVVKDITSLLETAFDEQLDLFGYPLPDAGGRVDNARAEARGTDQSASERERQIRAARALSDPTKPENVEPAFADGDRISSIIPALIGDPMQSWDIRGAVIKTPRDVLSLTRVLRTPYVETFKIILLNNQNEVVHAEIVSVGSLGQTLAEPKMFARVLARAPQVKGGFNVVISHNHPSGDPSPSKADTMATERFREIIEAAGHRLADHVVTNGERYHSYREAGENISYGVSPRITSKRPETRGKDADPKTNEQAPWEILPRDWLTKVEGGEQTRPILDTVRQVSPGALHVIYLTTRNRITALERIPDFAKLSMDKLRERIFKGVGIEAASSIIIDLPDGVTSAEAMIMRREFRAFAENGNFTLLDLYGKFDGENHMSARGLGMLEPGTDDSPVLAEKPNLPPGVKTAADLEREQDAEAARLSSAARIARHPAAVGDVEPGMAWAAVPKLTDEQLAQQVKNIDEHINENALDLADIERANLLAIRDATTAEQARRKVAPPEPVLRTPKVPADVAGTPVPGFIKPDPEAALIDQWRRGKAMRDEGRRTGNLTAEDEGQAIVTRAKAALDLRFPGWEEKAMPTAKPPRADTRAEVRPDQIEQDDGRNLPPPPPDEPTDRLAPAGDPPPPNRGRANEAFGHTATTPTWWASTWEKARAALVGFRGSIPELPAFPALAANTDRFIRDQGANFYDGLRAFYRSLNSANDYIQRSAEEQVAGIVSPLLRLGGKFNASAYRQLQRRQEQARLARAEGRPLPASARAEIDALTARLETHPYYLFNRLVFFMDMDWRRRNLKDSQGNPIRLPANLNETEIENELAQLGNAIAASPHAKAIEEAYTRHTTLVRSIADDLKGRDLLTAEHLANPVYFPHLTLEITRGDETIQRELRPERVRVGTEADFRGYLIEPTGSDKPIEGDYVRAMYYHLVQVGAHNLKADAVRDHIRPYDVRAEVEARAKELSKQRGVPVSWEQAFHEEYRPRGYVLYGTDSRDAFPTVLVDRDKLARRLGVILTGKDLQKQLAELGLKGVKLMPEDLRETLIQGQRETWIVPARVAEALRGIADRQAKTDQPIETALRAVNSWWKRWKLFMPQNHIRYEYGNVVADLEKVFSASPRTFRHMGQAAKEMRAFFQGEAPGEDLRAALKLGVINAITAQEINELQRLRAFEKFQTTGERVAQELRKRSSSALFQPVTNLLGVGDLSSVELSALREGITRYANFLANLSAIRAGARPDYAGAYWRDIEAIGDSRPGANDRAFRQAAQISRSTFGDYNDLSVTGQYLRDKFIPFYSWMEVNFKYHANLFRNLRDMVRADLPGSRAAAAGQAGRAVAALAAGRTSALAGKVVLRLALPYAAVALWNAVGPHGIDDDELSEEDRRRFHIRLGRDEDGKVLVIYGNTAFADVMKWFGGARFASAFGDWLGGRTDFVTALDSWASALPGDFVNNTIGSAGPTIKIPATVITGRSFFPDVLDARAIPDYDMRRAILGQVTDDFTADQVEKIVGKDYVSPKDLGTWAQQLILQVRQRDPESWAFYAIKDKAAEFLEQETGKSRDSAFNAPDQQVLRNFRRALYQGDVEQASRFYLRLLDLGYTSERFAASIRAQDPLGGLPKELRDDFVKGLADHEQRMLRRAYAYYTRMSSARGRERSLFPAERWGERGLERFRESPRLDALGRIIETRDQLSDEEIDARVKAEMRKSLGR